MDREKNGRLKKGTIAWNKGLGISEDEKKKRLHLYYLKNREYLLRKVKERYQEKSEEIKKYSRKWFQENKKHCIERNKKYRALHIDQTRRSARSYYHRVEKDNPKFKVNQNISRALWLALDGKKSGRRWETLVGYTLNDLITHLEKQFDNKMSWDNYGSYWHIDHKRPISWFKYETTDDEEFKKCWALSNLQPLEASENKSKYNRYESL